MLLLFHEIVRLGHVQLSKY